MTSGVVWDDPCSPPAPAEAWSRWGPARRAAAGSGASFKPEVGPLASKALASVG